MRKKDKLGRGTVSKEARRAKLRATAERLGRGRSLRHPFTWPGGSAALEMRVLSLTETQQAEGRAIAEVHEGIGDSSLPVLSAAELILTAKVKHMMFLACMVPGTDDKFFESAAELGDIATEDEITAVSNIYFEHKEDVDPELDYLGEEAIEVIDEAIKKKDSTSLKNIASNMRKNSLLILVGLLANSLEDSFTNT